MDYCHRMRHCDGQTDNFLLSVTWEEFGLSTQIKTLLFLQETAAACCEAICKTVIKGEDEWKIGSSKIFLKVKKSYN